MLCAHRCMYCGCECGYMYAIVHTRRSEDSFQYASSPFPCLRQGFLPAAAHHSMYQVTWPPRFQGFSPVSAFSGFWDSNSGLHAPMSTKTIILVHVDLARAFPIITSNDGSFSSLVLNQGWPGLSSFPRPRNTWQFWKCLTGTVHGGGRVGTGSFH